MASRQLCTPGAILRDEETEAGGTSSRETGSTSRENETPAALYVQLADIIREKIYSREWAVKSKIPSEHELMAQFHLARGTVRRAISALVDEGLLVREHGRGTFVAEPGLSHAVESRPFSFAEALHKQGRDFKTAVVDAWVTPAPIDVATELDVPEHSDVMFLRRLRYVDGVPIMCQESWLSLDECPGLCDVDFEAESLFNAVERCAGRKIKYSRMRYSARIADKDHGELLDCEEGAAILLLEQTISLVDYRPIEWSTTWFRPGQSIVSDAVQPD